VLVDLIGFAEAANFGRETDFFLASLGRNQPLSFVQKLVIVLLCFTGCFSIINERTKSRFGDQPAIFIALGGFFVLEEF
jgi:hypothetical protein